MREAAAPPPDWNGAYTRAMLEHSADVITIVDRDGTVLYVSPSIERLLGRRVEEHVGTSVFEHVHPDDRARVVAAFNTRMEEPEEVLATRFRFRHADGSWRVVESTGRNRLHDPAVGGVVISTRDVTERAEIERARQWQSVAMLASMDGVAILDAGGTYLSVNPAHAGIYGYATPAELNGRSWTSLYPDDEMRRLEVEVMPVLAAFGRWRGEATGRRRDGSTFPQEVSLSLLPDGGIVCVVRDITDRKRAEVELRESEIRFRTVVEALGEGIVINDLDDRVVYCNSRMAEMVGYSPEEVQRRSMGDFTLAGDAERLREIRDLRERGISSSYEIRIPRADGEVLWAHVNGTPFRTPEGKIVGTVAVLTDVTERRRAAEERERLLSLLNATLESTADAVVVVDETGRVTHFNQQFARMWTIPAEELDGEDVQRLIERSLDQVVDRAAVVARLAELATRPQDESFDLLALNDGREIERYSRPLRVEGTVVGRVWSFHDVTHRGAAEKALRRSERMLAETQRMGRMGSWEHDLATGLGTWSEEGYRICGRDPADGPVSAEVFMEMVHPDDRAWLEGNTAAAFASGGQHDGEIRIRLPSGEYRYLWSSVQVERDGAGVPRRMFGHLQDVTERKLAEMELQRTKDAAEEASRAKSGFLSSMSHELRTPLNSVIGFAGVLLKNRGGTLGEQEVKYLERIHANGRHLLGLINDVLDLSKIEAGKMEVERRPVAVGELVAETLGELAGAVRDKSVELRSVIPGQVEALETDPVKLKQVLINLVGNAIKFTGEGSVTVTVAVDPGTGRPVRLEVRDTGGGIEPVRLAAIFGAFEQGESGIARRYGGTGLGLTISRSLCDLMGHRLEVASAPGAGSTFSIVFGAGPGSAGAAAEAAEPREARASRDVEEGEPGGRLVLIIDDEPDARTLLTHHLEELGCRTLSAGSGPQGLRMARACRPDLITLDLLLPGMNGWEILRELKADPELRDIPVVVVSVVAGESRASVLGAVDLIEKPIDPDRLRAVLDRHLAPGTGRVLVVHEDDEAREHLARGLRDRGHETRSAGSGGEALRLLEAGPADLVVLDLPGGGPGAMELLRRLRESSAHRHVPVVVVTGRALTPRESRRMGRLALAVLPRDASLEAALAETIRRAWRRRDSAGDPVDRARARPAA